MSEEKEGLVKPSGSTHPWKQEREEETGTFYIYIYAFSRLDFDF